MGSFRVLVVVGMLTVVVFIASLQCDKIEEYTH